MRVLFLSPWNVACGIATYSLNLIEQLEAQGIKVEVFPNLTDFNALARLAKESNADVVHIQHEFGISMTLEPLMSIISKFKSMGKAVVITMHTEDKPATILLDGVADAMIFHNDMLNLANRNTFSNVYKIPHGIPEIKFDNPNSFYKKKYNIPEDAFVIGTCGFISNDRAAVVESFVSYIAPMMVANPKLYLHFPMSAHRSDKNEMYAKLIKQTIINIAEEHKFANRLQMTAEFLSTEEFRERLYTLDVGFAYQANLTIASNSGAASDIISCGVPLVVNDAKHFSHLKPYCQVVSGEVHNVVDAVMGLYLSDKDGTELYREALHDARHAIMDLGYSKIANNHIDIYNDAVKNKTRLTSSALKETTAVILSTFDKSIPITVSVPNSLWQVLLLWRKLAVLVEAGFSINLLVQNGSGDTSLSTLKHMLKGINSIKYADVGMYDDPRLVKRYSYNMSANLVMNLESWLSDTRSFNDCFRFINAGIGINYELKLNQSAIDTANSLIDSETMVVFPYDTIDKITVDHYYPCKKVCVIGMPGMEEQVAAAVATLKRILPDNITITFLVDNFRTIMACCKNAFWILTPFNEFLVYMLLLGHQKFSCLQTADLTDWQTDFLYWYMDSISPNKEEH